MTINTRRTDGDRRYIERQRAKGVPICECGRCDGWPMYWHKDSRLPDDGWYRCQSKLAQYRMTAYYKRLNARIEAKEARLASLEDQLASILASVT